MGAPADDELGEARILPGFVVIEKRLLREVIRTASAGIQLGHLRVTDRGRQTQQKREDDADPHGGRGGPVVAWAAKVSHRKAPGAMSAMAFIVKPVKPKVGFILTSPVFSAM